MKTVARVLIGLIVLGLLAIAGLTTFVYTRIETVPAADIPLVSKTFNTRYQAPAARALQGIADLRRERGWPSVSMAVAIRGQLVWAGVAGYADLAAGVPATTTTRYRVGSVAKPMTTVALGQLLDEGKIELDAAVGKLVDFPAKSAPFTVRQLAAHTAGIRHYAPGLAGLAETFHQTQYASVTDGLALFADDPLLFPPGTDFNYSSYGYNLLSAALEAADERDFLTLMQTRVFDRAGMRATQAEHLPNMASVPADLATPYMTYEQTVLRAPAINNSYKWAGGGFISTPSDLVRFGSALLDTSLVSPAVRAQLWQVSQLQDGSNSPGRYGLGFSIGDDNGDATVAHGGSSVGGKTYFVIYPDLGLVAAMVANVSSIAGPDDIRASTQLLARQFLRASPGD